MLRALIDTAARPREAHGTEGVPDRDQVFISYSRKADEVLARHLAICLRGAAFNVWLDKEKIRPGDNFAEQIERGLDESRHALFLVSEPWLEHEWTVRELELFARGGPERRRIAILRFAGAKARLPLLASHLHFVEWSDGSDAPACLWQVMCGLTGEDLGPSTDWPANGAALLARLPADGARDDAKASVAAAPAGLAPAVDDVYLSCDRDAQWGALGSLASTRSHGAILVAGAAGEAHDQFSLRIARLLPHDPPRRIVNVAWSDQPCPAQSSRLLADLALALEVDETALASAMRDQLRRHNVIVLQPTARCFGDALAGYFHHALPVFLRSLGPTPFALKLVQPIEAEPARIVARFSGWARALVGSREDHTFADAEAFIDHARKKAAPELPVSMLPQLELIRREHLEAFCERQNLPQARRAAFIAAVLTGARTSDDILRNIERHLPSAELT